MTRWFFDLSFLFQIIIVYFFLINIVTFFSFGLDKSRALENTRRTPEKKLWMLSLLGGTPAALVAMKYFRHKTKKISFQAMMILILCVQIIGIISLFYLFEPKDISQTIF